MDPTTHDTGLRWKLPVLTSLDGYRRSWVPRDLTAGLLIVAIAIPLSMGMAEVAGMPPVAGLYSCVLPLVAYAIFGSSRQLVIALDASTAAMLAAAVAGMAGGDPMRYAALAGATAVLVGLILIVAGSARLGIVADFLSEPVLLGYQAGLAMVVIASQLPRFLGITVETSDTIPRFRETFANLSDANAWSVVIGVAVLVTMIGVRRWRPAVPGALIGVAGATIVVAALDLQADGVAVLGTLPSGLPPLAIPDVSLHDLARLLPAAAAIALVAAADTLVSSRAFAARNGYEVNANRDLIGLGAANLSAGCSGGITTSASAARTAVAESVGSRSQVAGLTAATLMVLVLLFMTGPLANVPDPGARGRGDRRRAAADRGRLAPHALAGAPSGVRDRRGRVPGGRDDRRARGCRGRDGPVAPGLRGPDEPPARRRAGSRLGAARLPRRAPRRRRPHGVRRARLPVRRAALLRERRPVPIEGPWPRPPERRDSA